MEKLCCFCRSMASSLSWCCRKSLYLFSWLYKGTLLSLNPFCLQLSYFLFVSLGYFLLHVLDRRSAPNVAKSSTANFDLFFMSVSAVTGSSLVSIPMEDFSVSQLVVLIAVMFLGGDVFISTISLHLKRYKLLHEVESGGENRFKSDVELAIQFNLSNNNNNCSSSYSFTTREIEDVNLEDKRVKCLSYLGNLMLGYLVLIQLCGAALILLYLCLSESTRSILKQKRIRPALFSVFTSVSSFANCGLIANNDNMMAFKEDSVLLLMLIPLVTMGGTMFPPCFNLLLWNLEKTFPREELHYLKENAGQLGLDHLLQLKSSLFLAASGVGFTWLQFVLFCCLQWNSEAARGLNSFQKLIAGFFQSIATRYSGESVFDLSLFSPALLVVYIVMMYIPCYTFLLPSKKAGLMFDSEEGKGKRGEALEIWLPPQVVCENEGDGKAMVNGNRTSNFYFVVRKELNVEEGRCLLLLLWTSTFLPWQNCLTLIPNVHLLERWEFFLLTLLLRWLLDIVYPVIFVVLICMTEQTHIYFDPLNFNVLNIALEVESAYGNVGLSVGYSCERLLRVTNNGDCRNTSLSFSGKWSKKGKAVIIIVMFFGKLKKFTAGGGKAWHTIAP